LYTMNKCSSCSRAFARQPRWWEMVSANRREQTRTDISGRRVANTGKVGAAKGEQIMARVLIVDDERAIRELLQIALELEGYETLTFRNGRQVVELLAAESAEQAEQASAPERDRPAASDIILMDLMMPEMDGWAVCQYLEAHGELLARHHVVLMSAAAEPGDEFPALAKALLCKPFDLEQLLRLVASLGEPVAETVERTATPRFGSVASIVTHSPVALLAAS